MAQASLILGPERRRRWSEEQKLELMAAAFSPGAKVAEVARAADICTSLLYRWRQAHIAAQRTATVGFTPAVLIDEPMTQAPSATASERSIMVELPGGARVSIAANAPTALVAATLKALRP